ncbi:TB2/DP1, HVA22 family-domain-containing protein [Leucosporidium creatinivorum]|uniref:TB2/DP1, HVA22 family-domain-containing protein n=1 Tax=Leucosporidium creatinivorum TaxID=106004 RepID=A0A1Y2EKY9_9BASI|nr:TB2/DP1, HVA22 family-domain-containing protein [Leucosporidium creatinivorum]
MFYLLSRLVSTTAGSLYPAYASYKAIKSNDLQKLEVWLMYWVVMGFVMCAESTVEWMFAWFPFYYECKTIVILWLTLPQIQGSTYLYVAHVHPFLSSHEEEIDAAVADAKVRAKQVGLEWLNKGVQRLKELVVGNLVAQSLEGQPGAAPTQGQQQQQQHPNGPPPSYDQPSSTAGGLYNLAGNYLRQYGPAAVAAGTALLHPMNGRQPSVRSPTTSTNAPTNRRADQMRSLGLGHSTSEPLVPTSGISTATLTREEARRRRAELEAELAAINSENSYDSSPSSHSTRSASSSAAAPTPQYQQRILHPRSASAGHPSSLSAAAGNTGRRTPSPSGLSNHEGIPRDPVAARIERSFVGGIGFEEIERDELGDYKPLLPSKPGGGAGGSTAVGGGSWWKWGAGQQGGEVEALAQRKNA